MKPFTLKPSNSDHFMCYTPMEQSPPNNGYQVKSHQYNESTIVNHLPYHSNSYQFDMGYYNQNISQPILPSMKLDQDFKEGLSYENDNYPEVHGYNNSNHNNMPNNPLPSLHSDYPQPDYSNYQSNTALYETQLPNQMNNSIPLSNVHYATSVGYNFSFYDAPTELLPINSRLPPMNPNITSTHSTPSGFNRHAFLDSPWSEHTLPVDTFTVRSEATAIDTHPCQWESCNESYRTMEDMIRHVVETHIGSGKSTYECRWSGCKRHCKPFPKRHKMLNHFRTHTGEKPFICTFASCKKAFSRPDSLATHHKTHSDVRPYVCPLSGCARAYYHSRSLRKHLIAHERKGPGGIQNITGKGLQSHVRTNTTSFMDLSKQPHFVTVPPSI